jgi:hypothetical protein
LLSGLQTSLQLVGTLEETVVDQLATSYWRYRRMAIAESAEIAQATGSGKPTEGDSFFDLRIIAMTIVSGLIHRNAYAELGSSSK